MTYNEDTKFYKVTVAISANYDIYMEKGLKTKEIAELHDIPTGLVGHIMRTIHIERSRNAK